MFWPVAAIVGTPKVAVTLETEPDKAVVDDKLAAVNAAPPSMASGQPSPSESRSKLLGMPSLSVSTAQVALGWALCSYEAFKIPVISKIELASDVAVATPKIL